MEVFAYAKGRDRLPDPRLSFHTATPCRSGGDDEVRLEIEIPSWAMERATPLSIVILQRTASQLSFTQSRGPPCAPTFAIGQCLGLSRPGLTTIHATIEPNQPALPHSSAVFVGIFSGSDLLGIGSDSTLRVALFTRSMSRVDLAHVLVSSTACFLPPLDLEAYDSPESEWLDTEDRASSSNGPGADVASPGADLREEVATTEAVCALPQRGAIGLAGSRRTGERALCRLGAALSSGGSHRGEPRDPAPQPRQLTEPSTHSTGSLGEGAAAALPTFGAAPSSPRGPVPQRLTADGSRASPGADVAIVEQPAPEPDRSGAHGGRTEAAPCNLVSAASQGVGVSTSSNSTSSASRPPAPASPDNVDMENLIESMARARRSNESRKPKPPADNVGPSFLLTIHRVGGARVHVRTAASSVHVHCGAQGRRHAGRVACAACSCCMNEVEGVWACTPQHA